MNHESPHDILLLLGRIEGKLDAVIKRIDKMDSTIDNHEYRVGSVEGKLDAAVDRTDKLEIVLSGLDQRISDIEKAHARFKGGIAFLLALVSAAAILLRLTNGK